MDYNNNKKTSQAQDNTCHCFVTAQQFTPQNKFAPVTSSLQSMDFSSKYLKNNLKNLSVACCLPSTVMVRYLSIPDS